MTPPCPVEVRSRPLDSRDRGRHSVMNIPTVAAVMMPAVAQPSHRRSVGLTRFPMTVWSLVSSTTSTINGGASTHHAEPGAHQLDGGHQGKGKERGPEWGIAESRARDGVGGDPGGIVVGGPGDEARAEFGEEPPERPRRTDRLNAQRSMGGSVRGHLTGHRASVLTRVTPARARAGWARSLARRRPLASWANVQRQKVSVPLRRPPP